MRNVWLIWRKEMRSYFVSPIAYILLLMCALIFGFFFWSLLQAYLQFSMEAQMRGEMFPMNMPEEITRRLFGNIPVTGLFIIPLITMRLFAEEKRTGTIELLTTSPIRDGEIILGKWLAASTLYFGLLLLSVINVAFLFIYSHPDWKPILVAYLGLMLQGAALLAIGTFISTLTKNQIIAGAATFGVCLLIFVCGWVGEYNSDTWARVLSYMSISTHMESFTRGTLDLKDAIYYVTLIFVGLFLTARSMESLRWRS
ncbi:MAG TPA: ABC transporter permease [Candidatus Acidoferrum sp.]|jgi:ABC-2 type transport system permease protein